MTTPATFKTSDLKRLAKFVEANPGMKIEMEKNGVIIRVSPDTSDKNGEDDLAKYRNIDLT